MASSPLRASSSARSRSASSAMRITDLRGAAKRDAGTSKGSSVTSPISVPRSVYTTA